MAAARALCKCGTRGDLDAVRGFESILLLTKQEFQDIQRKAEHTELSHEDASRIHISVEKLGLLVSEGKEVSPRRKSFDLLLLFFS